MSGKKNEALERKSDSEEEKGRLRKRKEVREGSEREEKRSQRRE